MNKRAQSEPDETATIFTLREQKIAVAVIGMGKHLAKQGTLEFIERFSPQAIINIGIAGALSDALHIGTAYRISCAVDWPTRPHQPFVCADTGFSDLPTARLVTSDKPVFSNALRRTLQPFGEAVDMEGAIIAEICLSMNIECVLIKSISDFAVDGDRERLHKNIDAAAKTAASLVARKL